MRWRPLIAGALVLLAAVILVSGHEPARQPAPLAPLRGTPGPGPVLLIGGHRDTGLEILRVLRSRGDAVSIVARPGADTAAAEALGARVLRGDALDRASLDAAFSRARFRAVVSTLGRSARGGVRADDAGNRNAIDAARATGVRRFVLVTVIGAGNSRDAAYFLSRQVLGGVMDAKTLAESHLESSGLDYTIVRPGGLLDKAAEGQAFLTADVRSFSWIRRADLAQLVVRALDDPATTGRVYHAHDPDRTRFWVLPFN